MDNLKQLTYEHHKNAERQTFVKELLGGKITDARYAQYLLNQYFVYHTLEKFAQSVVFDDIPELLRSNAIWDDYLELWKGKFPAPTIMSSTTKYLRHISSISNDPQKLLAHVYVRHMGDLSGGQMIAKRVPGQGRYYQFDKDIAELKSALREKLDDSLAVEARVCFDFATELFKEMSEDE